MPGTIGRSLLACACLLGWMAATAARAATAATPQRPDRPTDRLARDIFQQLIEIDTTDSAGDTTAAAQAMARRLLDAGFPAADVLVAGPDARKKNLIARYRGGPNGALRPMLLIGHLDVVEAHREDWSTDPFRLVEADGYFYGRGTQDMKSKDAIFVADFIRLRREGYVPDRVVVLALTADEEGGESNGVSWLLAHHRELVDAEFALNPDAGDVEAIDGRAAAVQIEAAEKLYADFQLAATSAGGHGSRPHADNAIYRVAHALSAIERTPFPIELNPVTRAYFARMARIEKGATADDIRAILDASPDAAAVGRLSQNARYNATLRTTCVATLVSGGHAANALPQRAEANVNCRILPGHSQEETRLRLVEIIADPAITVRYRSDAGAIMDHGSTVASPPPQVLRPDIVAALTQVAATLWPGVPVVPEMETWATDSKHTVAAGIPSYGISGVVIDRDDVKGMHGRDERIGAAAFYDGVEFYYLFLKVLTTPSRR